MTIAADHTASALVPSRAASPPPRRQWHTSGDAGVTVYVADGGARSLVRRGHAAGHPYAHDPLVHMWQARQALTRARRPPGRIATPSATSARLTDCWLTPNRNPTSMSVSPLT